MPAWHEATPEQRVLLDAAWRGGELSFLLTPSQYGVHEQIRAWEAHGPEKGGRVFSFDSSRRWGKSFELIELACEDAIVNRGWRIVYIAPTFEMVRKIVLPLMAQILLSCPPELVPEFIKSENYYRFPNGSRIELIGLDVRPDGARGTGVDRVYMDEAGFFEQLEYLINSIIYPQMLGREHARIIAASTPPVTPMHYWSEAMVPECISRDAHTRKTLDDADQYSEAEIEHFYSLMPGGRRGVAARREYGAEHIADDSMAIVPEFPDAEEGIVRAVEPPVWRDCYVALDPGFHDLSAVLFGYWWFEEQTLVIEDEIAAPRMNSRDLANQIKAMESRLWGNVRRRGSSGSWETRPQPYLRISDNDPRLLADLALDHQLPFVATQKDNLVQQVDQVRVAVQQGKIVIHPRCKKLIKHLRMGVWKKLGSLFAREGGDLGHFDTIAALVYMWRNVQKRRNPLPPQDRFIAGDLRLPRQAAGLQSKWAERRPHNDNGRIETPWRRDPRRPQRITIRTGKAPSP